MVLYCRKSFGTVPDDITPVSCVYYVPEKPLKHRETIRRKHNRKNKKRRLKDKSVRNTNLSIRVKSIKDSGLVVNFSDEVIPDCAYLYLSKGSSFVPSVSASKHDIVFDCNEFLRKLSWRTYFHSVNNVDTVNDTVLSDQQHLIERKLSLPSSSWPVVPIKLLDNACNKIKNFVNSLEVTKLRKHANLSYIERKGLDWCIQMKNSNRLHFSQADKGGAIVLMDPIKVQSIILSDLCNESNYINIPTDPRCDIEKALHRLCIENIATNGVTIRENFLITGHSEIGKSHNPLIQTWQA